ncbi:MAG: hypothetical protein CM15mP83_9180 [Flavobacteriaceae bacterium]|nr:MAG: hypothetical protein CM15mP83_9180 [Flavobacteriaceae bacterium]
MISYKANELRYRATVSSTAFAVFSEMYYPHGWKSFINGEEVSHHRVNYALRGLLIPAGTHEILFRFEPDVIARGSRIRLAGYGIFSLIVLVFFAVEEIRIKTIILWGFSNKTYHPYKLLLATAGGSGVQRWWFFTNELAKRGWTIDVITVQQPAGTPIDSSFIGQAHPNINVYPLSIWEPGKRLYSTTKSKTSKGCFLICSMDSSQIFFFPDARQFLSSQQFVWLKAFGGATRQWLITTGPLIVCTWLVVQFENQMMYNGWLIFVILGHNFMSIMSCR